MLGSAVCHTSASSDHAKLSYWCKKEKVHQMRIYNRVFPILVIADFH